LQWFGTPDDEGLFRQTNNDGGMEGKIESRDGIGAGLLNSPIEEREMGSRNRR
jgi:hypothetical protein